MGNQRKATYGGVDPDRYSDEGFCHARRNFGVSCAMTGQFVLKASKSIARMVSGIPTCCGLSWHSRMRDGGGWMNMSGIILAQCRGYGMSD